MHTDGMSFCRCSMTTYLEPGVAAGGDIELTMNSWVFPGLLSMSENLMRMGSALNPSFLCLGSVQ